MKTTCYTIVAAVALAASAQADIIAQWSFNSVPPDTATTTGSTTPTIGSASISVIGGASQTFSSASPTGGGTSGESTDPATTDDTAYHTSSYPAPGTGNKTRGIQVRVSTVGYESLVITWDQRQSSTASRYFRFQYSLDGLNFTDRDVVVTGTQDLWFNARTVNLNSITGVNNNPNFAFRLVAEFEDTAIGSGVSGYVATTSSSSYASGGTVRFDMLTISGSPPDANNFPTITSIPNQTIRANTSTGALPFQVGDVETPADQLVVTGESSNPTLIPNEALRFEGGGSDRTLTVDTAIDEIGTATITLTVRDGGGKATSTSFVVTVLPENTPPSISAFTNVHAVVNAAFSPIDFTISDAEQDASTLTVVASSSNQGVIPDANLAVTGAGNNRTLSISAVSGVSANSAITVTVTDSGGLSVSRSFNAMVVPSSRILLSEAFDYPDGPTTTNSGGLWTTHSGIFGQSDILAGELQVTSSDSEDINARLIGGSYDVNGSTVLYASFTVNFSAFPSANGDYFAHFREVVGSFRARTFATTSNTTIGFYRLGLANNNQNLVNGLIHPAELSLGAPVFVVLRYNVAAGTSTLWVNPTSETDISVSPTDNIVPAPIHSFAFRQSGGVGDLRVDNLLVGLSFEDVTPHFTRVRVRRAGSAVEVYWPQDKMWEGFFLESTPRLDDPDWQPVQEGSRPEGDWEVVTIANPTGNAFFRLKKVQ